MTKQNPNEGDVKKAIKDLLDRHGWFWFMPPANTYGSNGISDILALKDGFFLAIEVKFKKTEGTQNQEDFLEDVRKHGGFAMLVNQAGLPRFSAWLKTFDRGLDHAETGCRASGATQ